MHKRTEIEENMVEFLSEYVADRNLLTLSNKGFKYYTETAYGQ